MELFADILILVFQIFGEVILHILFEVLSELGIRYVKKPLLSKKPIHPVLAINGYILLGSITGGLSLLIFPKSFINSEVLKILNLIGTPLIAGFLMSALGKWRSRKEQELIRLDKFSYGFLFALAMASVRYFFTN